MSGAKVYRFPRWRERFGPWAVVTGASEGIGREIASQLAERGLHVVLVARREAVLASFAASLEKRYGIQTRVLPADLSSAAGVMHVIEQTSDLDAGLLVAAAGYGTSGPLLDADLQQELTMLDVNCRAVVEMTVHFGRRFVRRGRGGIILMSSLLAFQGVPRAAHYAATKAYIQSLAEGLRAELKPLGVDVLASAPGPVHSGFASRADMRMNMALKPEEVAGATLNALGRTTTVRPGWLSWFLEFSLSMLPRAARILILSQVMGGMTVHQDARAKAQTRGAA